EVLQRAPVRVNVYRPVGEVEVAALMLVPPERPDGRLRHGRDRFAGAGAAGGKAQPGRREAAELEQVAAAVPGCPGGRRPVIVVAVPPHMCSPRCCSSCGGVAAGERATWRARWPGRARWRCRALR